jgi:isoleucyl-tRNA synthetase
MLHPLSPFVTDYLYLTCFGKRKSVLLESWPKRDEKLVDAKVEGAFDKIKDVVSLANAARNLAGLKRRWPIGEAMICGKGMAALEIEGASDALKSQLNVEKYRLIEIPTGSQLEKVAGLLDSKMPIAATVSLIRKNVAPRVKADIGKVAQAFETVDKIELLRSLQKGSYSLAYDGKSVDISPSDVEIAYKVEEGYSVSERGDLVVFISTSRDKNLIAEGLLRDLARNLQQLRKERQYNPTDILNSAYVAGLADDEIGSLGMLKDKMTYLVRVKGAALSKEPMPNVNYKAVEIDGREFKLSVE